MTISRLHEINSRVKEVASRRIPKPTEPIVTPKSMEKLKAPLPCLDGLQE